MKSGLFNGREWRLRQFSGASGTRVSHAGGAVIGEHRHDWPNITIQLLGACHEETAVGRFRLGGPSVTWLPGGSHHANLVGRYGLETIGLLFDPAWLGREGSRLPPDRAMNWRGGAVGLSARRLASAWMDPAATEGELARATAGFLRGALAAQDPPVPPWLDDVSRALDEDRPPGAAELARRLGLHPAWLARAYRRACGEGMADTVRRRRVGRAVHALRSSDTPLAQVAAGAGFCDQQHMNRCVKAVLGQTPLALRARS